MERATPGTAKEGKKYRINPDESVATRFAVCYTIDQRGLRGARERKV
jgi:hypothetical protein